MNTQTLSLLERCAKECEQQGRRAGDGMTFYTAVGQAALAIRKLKNTSGARAIEAKLQTQLGAQHG